MCIFLLVGFCTMVKGDQFTWATTLDCLTFPHMREVTVTMVYSHSQVPGAITVAGSSDFSHLMPVELAGWLMNQLPAAAGGAFPWVLIATEDRHLRLPTALLMRGPVTASCVCGLTTEKQDSTVKVRLDGLIADQVIPRARAMDGLQAIKWALQSLCRKCSCAGQCYCVTPPTHLHPSSPHIFNTVTTHSSPCERQ